MSSNRIQKLKIGMYYTLFSPIYDFLMLFDEPKGVRGDLISRLEIGQGDSVIEIGAGTGKNLNYYPLEAQVVLVEQNPNMFLQARLKAFLRGADSVFFDLRDATSLPYSSDQFDFGVATYSLSTIPEQKEAFIELTRVVRPGGKIAVLDFLFSSKYCPSMIGFDLERLLAGKRVRNLELLYKEDYPYKPNFLVKSAPGQRVYIFEKKG